MAFSPPAITRALVMKRPVSVIKKPLPVAISFPAGSKTLTRITAGPASFASFARSRCGVGLRFVAGCGGVTDLFSTGPSAGGGGLVASRSENGLSGDCVRGTRGFCFRLQPPMARRLRQSAALRMRPGSFMFLTRHNGYIASRRTSHLFFAVDLAVIPRLRSG